MMPLRIRIMTWWRLRLFMEIEEVSHLLPV